MHRTNTPNYLFLIQPCLTLLQHLSSFDGTKLMAFNGRIITLKSVILPSASLLIMSTPLMVIPLKSEWY